MRFIHIVARINHFFFADNIPLCRDILICFIYSSVDENQVGSIFLLVLRKLLMNIHTQAFVWKFLFLLGKYLGIDLLDYMLNVCSTSLETANLAPRVAVRTYISNT